MTAGLKYPRATYWIDTFHDNEAPIKVVYMIDMLLIPRQSFP